MQARLEKILPQYQWFSSKEKSIYTDMGLLSRKEEAENFNTVFTLLTRKYPTDTVLPQAEVKPGKIILTGVTDESLTYLESHADETNTLLKALGRYHFNDLLLEKPNQALALIKDLETLEKFNPEYDNLLSLKKVVSSDLGKVAAECLYELHHCSFFFSNLTESNKNMILQNIQMLPSILPALKYLNSYTFSTYLTQEIFDIIIKHPENAFDLAQAYIKISNLRTAETEDSRDLKLLESYPNLAFKMIQTLEKASLLETQYIKAIAAKENHVPTLQEAMEKLGKKRLLTQETLQPLMDKPENAIDTANEIIEKQPSITKNPYPLFLSQFSSNVNKQEDEKLIERQISPR